MSYIVVNAARGPAPRPFLHETVEAAQREASRLAQSEPGVKFYVLETLGYVVCKKVDWQPLSDRGYVPDLTGGADIFADEEIPF